MIRTAYLVLVMLSPTAIAGIITYEGNVFPEDVGWERVGTFDADRWIDSGWLSQEVELGVWGPPPYGEFDGYQRSLSDFATTEAFFIEWRVETNVPSSEIGGVPVSLSAFGHAAANYHFTITERLVRVIRDNRLPIIYVDIEPGIPHSYRLELHGDELYAWYVDGQLIDSGVPEGPYPNSDSKLIWAAGFFEHTHTTRWDYVRYGVIPDPATVLFFLPGAACLAWWRRQRRSHTP